MGTQLHGITFLAITVSNKRQTKGDYSKFSQIQKIKEDEYTSRIVPKDRISK